MSWTAPNAAMRPNMTPGLSFTQANACLNGHTGGGGVSFETWARCRGWSWERIAQAEQRRLPAPRLMVEPLRAADELASAA